MRKCLPVSIGAENKGLLVTEVQSIIAALAGIAALVGVGARGGDSGHKGEDDESLHDELLCVDQMCGEDQLMTGPHSAGAFIHRHTAKLCHS